jgi:DNA primase catalytic core
LARISDIELERLKREVSLERLVEAKGVKLERKGPDNFVGRCLFHTPDDTPSFVVSRRRNLWHCMGACQRGGSVIDFVMLSEGVSFRHAVELLRSEVLLAAPAPGAAAPPPKHATARKLQPPVDFGADDTKLLGQVVDYYHQRLKETPAALEYLKRRGLGSDVIEHFKLGFADRTLGLRLPVATTQAGADIRGRLQKLGVFRESGHEHLAGSVVVPLVDGLGYARGLYGRKVTPRLRPGTPLHLYLPGPHRVVFNERALVKQPAVILCEALIDALSFWSAGFRAVTCAYGVEGFTPMHLEVLKGAGAKDIFIAFDRDDAGDKAASALGQRLMAEGFSCWRVLFPRCMDANEYAVRRCNRAAYFLGVTLSQSQWMGPDAGAKAPPALEPTPLPVLAASPPSVTSSPPAKSMPAPAGTEKTSSSAASTSVAPEPVSASSAPAPSSAAVQSSDAAAVTASSTAPAPATGTAMGPAVEKISSPSSPAVAGDEGVDELRFVYGGRRYRVRGLKKNSSLEVLKVNLLVSDEKGEAFHVDTLDMYSAKARAAFLHQAAHELRLTEDALKRDFGALLLQLEACQEQHLKALLEPKKVEVSMRDDERATALELLKAPDLLGRILQDFERCGVVGEENNKLVGYLAAVSRKLEEPLAVLIQSSSAAGKTSLMEAVLAFVPEEERVKYSAMTGQALFYMGELELKHKVLAVVEEEGASRAAYALKLLQSEGELTIASTGKDPHTGKLVTHEYRVEGPAQLFLTTTAVELDEELLNRCLVLSVDEERAQTKAIHQLQRKKQTLEGQLQRRDREATLKVHQNAQRLLRPLLVANPFAEALTFLDDRTRTRRDFPKYLTLIRALALLHQHQRPVKVVQHGGRDVEYVEATLDDVAIANRLAAAVLGKSLDELPPQTRRVLQLLDGFVKKRSEEQQLKRSEVRFTRREVREAFKLGPSQLAVHLARLEALEYVAARRGHAGPQYELLYDGGGERGAPVLPGLADLGQLGRYDPELPALRPQLPAPFRGASGPLPAPFRGGASTEFSSGLLPLAAADAAGAGNAHYPLARNGASYSHVTDVATLAGARGGP